MQQPQDLWKAFEDSQPRLQYHEFIWPQLKGFGVVQTCWWWQTVPKQGRQRQVFLSAELLHWQLNFIRCSIFSCVAFVFSVAIYLILIGITTLQQGSLNCCPQSSVCMNLLMTNLLLGGLNQCLVGSLRYECLPH